MTPIPDHPPVSKTRISLSPIWIVQTHSSPSLFNPMYSFEMKT